MKHKDFMEISKWMYRNARPLDLCRFNYHFEGSSKDKVVSILYAYQNPDGGFGHALEPDAWNPNSSPIQTWVATEILEEIELSDPNHAMIKSILRYLRSGVDFENNRWLNTVASNNEYPRAPWWTHRPEAIYNLDMNPTASLIAFVIKYDTTDFYQVALDIAREAIEQYLQGEYLKDMHELCCYSTLYHALSIKNVETIDMVSLKVKLLKNVNALIEVDTSKWKTEYSCKPSQFINDPNSMFYKDNSKTVNDEIDDLINYRNTEGIWDITWDWGSYPDVFPIAKKWWQGNLIIKNLLFLRNFKRLNDY